MARSIANLAVSVVAKTASFQKGLKRATRSINRFGRRLNSLRGSLRPLTGLLTKFGAVGTAIAGGGFAVLLKRAFEVNDVLGKTAAKLGVTTEALAAMNLAAREANIDTEKTNKVLENFARSISATGAALSTYRRAFDVLGLDPKVLKDQDDLIGGLQQVISAAKELPSRADAIGALRDLLGRSGAEALNLSDNLAEVAAFTRSVGTAISAVDSKTIQNANDAVGRLREAFAGLLTQISVQLAPVVESFSKSLTGRFADIRASMGNIVRGIASGFRSVLDGPFGFFVDAIEALKIGFDVLRGSFNALIESMLMGLRSALEVAAKLPDSLGGNAFRGASEFIGEFENEFGNKADKIKRDLDAALLAPSWRESLRAWVDDTERALTEVQEKARDAAAQAIEGVPELLARPVEEVVKMAEAVVEKVKGATRAGSFQSRRVGELGFSSASALASARVPLFARDNRVEFEQLTVLKKIEKNTREIDAGGLA